MTTQLSLERTHPGIQSHSRLGNAILYGAPPFLRSPSRRWEGLRRSSLRHRDGEAIERLQEADDDEARFVVCELLPNAHPSERV